ncbi:hypothetical protein TRFO_04532 [Tritrichomonas foetus]|uniref:Uncharacterized protein n=1 Tax=Tritrichomonas foetus TaxID=1144522 RepID=A0A1J4KIE7_9EUKA|nr:hypothetical protein TRFO_04532 [Tritrichomonas foetus]|eukprot:OHT09462.1 hypothetical protein TRFO_04532 [Tritrichomonas foetus]
MKKISSICIYNLLVMNFYKLDHELIYKAFLDSGLDTSWFLFASLGFCIDRPYSHLYICYKYWILLDFFQNDHIYYVRHGEKCGVVGGCDDATCLLNCYICSCGLAYHHFWNYISFDLFQHIFRLLVDFWSCHHLSPCCVHVLCLLSLCSGNFL